MKERFLFQASFQQDAIFSKKNETDKVVPWYLLMKNGAQQTDGLN